MILISNSYLDPSPGFVASVADYLGDAVDGRRLRACTSSQKFSAGVSPTGRDIWLTIPPVYQAMFDEAKSGSKDNVLALKQMIDTYGHRMVTNLSGFETILSSLITQLSLKESKLIVDEIYTRSSAHANLFGAAMLQWLGANRNSRQNYNDIMLLAVLCRENFANIRDGKGIMVGTGYLPDIDYDYPNFTDSAVGFGARHTKWWMGSNSFYQVSPEYHKRAYFYSGRFPWWLQVGMMAMDVQRKSLYKRWLIPSNSIEENPSLKESFYPYFMLEQPSLLSSRVDTLKGTTYVATADVYFTKVLGSKVGVVDMLKTGIPSNLPKEVLFSGIDDPVVWENLIAGCDNRVDIEQAKSPLGFTTSPQTSALLKEFAYGAPVLNENIDAPQIDSSVYYPKIKIKLQ